MGAEEIHEGGAHTTNHDVVSAQPAKTMTQEEYDKINVNNDVLGKKAMDEANKMLATIAGKEFDSALELVKAWDSAVRPVSDKYGVEISSRIFFRDEHHFMVGAAYSDGNPVGVNTSLAPDVNLKGWIEHGYIHTHPWNDSFSGQDIYWLKFRDNPMNERAYVTLPNHQIYEGRLGGPSGHQRRIF